MSKHQTPSREDICTYMADMCAELSALASAHAFAQAARYLTLAQRELASQIISDKTQTSRARAG